MLRGATGLMQRECSPELLFSEPVPMRVVRGRADSVESHLTPHYK